MQKVFNNDMVAHVWAQQNQDNGRNANGSFYFNQKTIYSYGSHFPIAKFITNDIVLFNSSSYGITTAKHCSLVRQSLNYETIFTVPNVDLLLSVKGRNKWTKSDNKKGHKENVEYYKKQIAEYVLKASRARNNKDYYNSTAINLLNEANNYIDTFKLRFKRITLPNSDELLKADKKQAKKARLAKIKMNKQILKENKDKINRWLNGELVSLPYSIDTMIRIQGDIVQTSKNASFPIDHARKAYKIIKRCHDRKQEFISNGHTIKLGYFAIDKIETNGNVKAGCHYLKFENMQLVGEKLLSLYNRLGLKL